MTGPLSSIPDMTSGMTSGMTSDIALRDIALRDIALQDIALIERHTLAKLTQLKDELIALKALPVRPVYDRLAQRYGAELAQMASHHRQRKQARDRNRIHFHNTLQGDALTKALDSLKRESQRDSLEHRHLKQKRNQELAPFAQTIAQAEQQMRAIKHQYTTLSRQWQVQMQTAYAAEQAGAARRSLLMLYQDEALIVVDKPAGLLSVPGRQYHLQDSVLSRLRCQLPDNTFLQVVHRLDQATSGILVLVTSATAHAALGQQFSQHQVRKTYEAILTRPVARAAGTVELPLWGNPAERPRQSVSAIHGKPSVTQFQVLQAGERPRVQLVPHTGRTHQIRVHAAHGEGLNSPIFGDPLYGGLMGRGDAPGRLHLHARCLELIHPVTQKRLRFSSDVPF